MGVEAFTYGPGDGRGRGALTVAMVAPTFAKGKITYSQCAPPGGLGETEYAFTKQQVRQYERQGYDCVKVD